MILETKILYFIFNLLAGFLFFGVFVDVIKRKFVEIKSVIEDPEHFFIFKISWTNKTIKL